MTGEWALVLLDSAWSSLEGQLCVAKREQARLQFRKPVSSLLATHPVWDSGEGLSALLGGNERHVPNQQF